MAYRLRRLPAMALYLGTAYWIWTGIQLGVQDFHRSGGNLLLLVVLGWAVMARAPSWVAFAVIAAQVTTFAIFWWNPPFANIHLEEGVTYGFNPSFGLLLIAAAVAMSIAVAGSTGPSSTVDQLVG